MELSHILETRDIHAVYLDRLRAEYLTKTLWKLTHEHVHWQTLPLTPLEAKSSGGDSSGGVGFSSRSPRYVEFVVPPVAMLDFGGERWRIWKDGYGSALQNLPLDQQDAFKEHMLKRRYSAVYAVIPRWAMVRRTTGASRELAIASLKILGFFEETR